MNSKTQATRTDQPQTQDMHVIRVWAGRSRGGQAHLMDQKTSEPKNSQQVVTGK